MDSPKLRQHYKVTHGGMIVGGICRDTDCLLPEHEHSEAQLSVVFSGTEPTLVTHGDTGRTSLKGLRADSFIYLAPDHPHRLNWSAYGEVLHLWMSKEDLQELSEQTKCPLPTSRVGDHLDHGLREIGRILVDEFDASGGLSPAMINHATSLMMARLLRVSERMSRETTTGMLSLKRLQAAVDIIREAPEREFTLLELANLCNSSVFHFARSFSFRMGYAPFAFQRQLRMKKAKHLLVSTDLTIEAVGSCVGFENATHFSRMFRRQTGYTPRDYRKLYSVQH